MAELTVNARILSVNNSNDETRRYVNFVSFDYDLGEFSNSFRSDEWNGFKKGEDVTLVLEPTKRTGTREISGGRHMATLDLGLRIAEVRHAKAGASS